MDLDTEIQTLRTAYDALSTLDREAQRRCMIWLEQRLIADDFKREQAEADRRKATKS